MIEGTEFKDLSPEDQTTVTWWFKLSLEIEFLSYIPGQGWRTLPEEFRQNDSRPAPPGRYRLKL